MKEGTQDILAREQLRLQATITREHESTQDMSARECVSTQRTLAREYVFSTHNTQFSRLLDGLLNFEVYCFGLWEI